MPIYSNPDPKTLSFTYTLFSISEILLIFSIVIFPILAIVVIYNKILKKVLIFKHIMIYLLGLGLLMFVYGLDMFDLGTWIAD